MYGLRTDVHLFQCVWYSSSFRYLVVVSGLPLIWYLLSVDWSLFCNTLYTGWCVVVKVVTVLLGVCFVSFICVGLSVCASACTFKSTKTSFSFAFHWFRRCASPFPCGRRHVFLFMGLVGNFPNGFISLDPYQFDCYCAGH